MQHMLQTQKVLQHINDLYLFQHLHVSLFLMPTVLHYISTFHVCLNIHESTFRWRWITWGCFYRCVRLCLKQSGNQHNDHSPSKSGTLPLPNIHHFPNWQIELTRKVRNPHGLWPRSLASRPSSSRKTSTSAGLKICLPRRKPFARNTSTWDWCSWHD